MEFAWIPTVSLDSLLVVWELKIGTFDKARILGYLKYEKQQIRYFSFRKMVPTESLVTLSLVVIY